MDPLNSSPPAGDLAALFAAVGGRPATAPSPLPTLAMAPPAGGILQHSQLARLCEQLCADSAAAAAAAVKAAAAGNALLGALGSGGSGSGPQELLLGQLVLQDMQLLQRMQDNVLLQLRIVHAGCTLASAAATHMQPVQPAQLLVQLLAQLVSGGGGMPAPPDAGAAAQGAAMQCALQMQWAALAQPPPQQQQPLPDGRRSAPPLPPAGNQQQAVAASKPAEPDSSSGGLQHLQGLIGALQSQPGSTGAGSGLHTVQPPAAAIGVGGGTSGGTGGTGGGAAGCGTDASSGQDSASRLLAALCLLRGFGKDAALEPPSVYSEQTAGRGSSAAAAAGNGGAAGVTVGASSPTSAIQLAPAAGQPAVQPAV